MQGRGDALADPVQVRRLGLVKERQDQHGVGVQRDSQSEEAEEAVHLL